MWFTVRSCFVWRVWLSRWGSYQYVIVLISSALAFFVQADGPARHALAVLCRSWRVSVDILCALIRDRFTPLYHTPLVTKTINTRYVVLFYHV